MTALIQTIDTADGPFTILVDAQQQVLASGWTDEHEEIIQRIAPKNRPENIHVGEMDAVAAVRAYYRGDLQAIDTVAVKQFGTALQAVGWAALRSIEPGAPLTYTEFAAHLGSPAAVRAAASICARNAPALFVPCHRVLRSDGTLGGFAWGVQVKESLLAREAAGVRIR